MLLLITDLSTHPFIHILDILTYYTLPIIYFLRTSYKLGSWKILKSKLEPSRIPVKNKYHKQFLFPNTFIRFRKQCQLQRTWKFCWCSLSFRFRQRNQTIKQNSSLRASSPIWASEASLTRARERAAKPGAGEGKRNPGPSLERSREAHFACPNRRACSQASKTATALAKCF